MNTEKTATTHWADQYRDAVSGSLEHKIYLAACFCSGNESRSRAVGQYAFDHGCAIWHASWALSAKQYPCACSPCAALTAARANVR